MSIGSDYCSFPGCQKRIANDILPAVYKSKQFRQPASPFAEGCSCTTDWEVGKEYAEHRNTEIRLGTSFSYRLSGQIVEDEASAPHRCRSQVFPHQGSRHLGGGALLGGMPSAWASLRWNCDERSITAIAPPDHSVQVVP